MSTDLNETPYPKRDCRCGGSWVRTALISCDLKHFTFTCFGCDKCPKRTFTLKVKNK